MRARGWPGSRVVERRALRRCRARRWRARCRARRVSVSGACTRVGRVAERVERHRVGRPLGLHERRGGLRGGGERRALHGAADVERDADRGAASRRPTASSAGLPFSLSLERDVLELVAVRGDHGRRDQRIARRVDLRDLDARRGRGRRAAGAIASTAARPATMPSARLMPRPCRTPSGAAACCVARARARAGRTAAAGGRRSRRACRGTAA